MPTRFQSSLFAASGLALLALLGAAFSAPPALLPQPATVQPATVKLATVKLATGLAATGLAATGLAATGSPQESTLDSQQHGQRVMESRFCASCHPAIYAEHESSTHGRAFTDSEVRLATGHFDHGDCIICHTPRPIFETGIGMNPMRRHYDLEEGNSCMTCHWKEGYDYDSFHGGSECQTAFDERVGEVEACASCHRNHGTPYQWEKSPLGKGKGRVCIDCHMRTVERPVALGMPARAVSSHGFPGSRSEEHLRRAYSYDAEVSGSEVVVTIENRGAGHNFPTELKQRSVESLVIVKDVDGTEVARSRMVFRDPYKRPYGLTLPVNTQIPSGQSVEHHVPLQIANGTVECELHFKLYYPIEDFHPDLARRLEVRKLVFEGVTPSTAAVESAPDVPIVTPESISVDQASLANLVDFAHPPIGTTEVDIPDGQSPEDIQGLIDLFQFPVPAANGEARKRLVAIGAPAIPALLEAIGSWDNKTWNQAMAVLTKIGAASKPALIEALASPQLYVRVHARQLLVRLGASEVEPQLVAALQAPNALDRASAATALGDAGLKTAVPALEESLGDADPDVVRAAALALSQLDARESVPAMQRALARFTYAETRRELASALARLGDRGAVAILLEGLDQRDDLLREKSFEAFFDVTGLHLGYDPMAPRPDRLEAIAHLQSLWAERGADLRLRAWQGVDPEVEHDLWGLIGKLGDGKEDEELVSQLLEADAAAVPSLVLALKFPPGFAEKRRLVCDLLARLTDRRAVPALIATLRDPVISVAARACIALESIQDGNALPSVQRYEQRLHSLAASGRLPAGVGSADLLLAQSARARLALGEDAAARDLVTFLLSQDEAARLTAFLALKSLFGFDLSYDPSSTLQERRQAAARWAQALE